MKPEANTIRSRNARLNQARRGAENLVIMLKPERRPDNEDAWNVLFAEARDDANDIHQCIHEASAYHNVLKDQNAAANPGRSLTEPPSLHKPDRFQGEDASQDKREPRNFPAVPPCIVCRTELPNVPNVPNQPLGGAEFTTPGHYGCCVFDPMDGTKLAINICDGCLDAARIRGDVLHFNSNRYQPWK